MKVHKYLTQEEAVFLNKKPKKSEKGRKRARYYITLDELEVLKQYKDIKSEPDRRRFVETLRKLDKHGNIASSVEKLQSEPIQVPEGMEVVKVSNSLTTGQQWVQYKKAEKSFNYLEARDSIIRDMDAHSVVYPKIQYEKTSKEEHCLVFDPSDIHIGKIARSFETGEEYNSQIAVQRVKLGLLGILDKAQGFKFDKILFIAGNDILHVDNPQNTTTSGTRQDTDGMFYDSFLMAKSLLVDIIETLMQIAPVEVVFNPSNHDYMSGFFLLDSIASWFRLSKDVTFNNDMSHRKYTRYYDNLIATTHMDGAKQDLLPLLAAQESNMWDSTTRRYIYGHHVHHKIAKDYVGITLETLRSPSGADSWHHRNGYQHSPISVEAFIHHKTDGQVCRITHNF